MASDEHGSRSSDKQAPRDPPRRRARSTRAAPGSKKATPRAQADALYKSAITLNSTLELDAVLDRVVDHVGRVVPHDAASLLLIEGDFARVVRSRGYQKRGPDGSHREVRYAVTDTYDLKQMLTTNQPCIVADIAEYPHRWHDPYGEKAWLHAYAGAPLAVEGEVIGFLTLLSRTPDFFQPAHAEQLLAYATLAATAIHNADRYAQLEDSISEMEAYVRQLNEFSHTVAHSLKAPLQVILGYSNLLNTDFNEIVTDEMHGYLSHIEAYTLKMKTIVDNLLLLAELRKTDVKIARVDMAGVIKSAVERYEYVIAERGIVLEMAGSTPPVMGVGPWLEEVVANLVDNAIKYMGTDTADPRIIVRGEVRGTVAHYDVQDHGLGIDPESQKKIFQMFARFHTQTADGTGLGLSIVQNIILRLDGRIGVTSTPGKGSTFWFELPVPPA